MKKAIIVAYDRNRAIGRDGDLPWGRSLPADLAHFKQLTKGGGIMGIWQETSRVRHPADADNAYDFDFVIYKRVS